ncbi:aminotransferase class III-fold pyridoxal phosphate-dependent enzyme [Pelagibacterales bacterium SAG-MED22]|nr:aminotransferase class III-fold pyridoxal phosphate-dependent enzyme [Pelagibacterales bacterium SAG-MED22]
MKKVKKINIKNSNNLYKKALKIIPYGSQTYSKGIKAFSDGVSPKFLAKGKGCEVWDVDGNKFIDYVMANQPLLLGYADRDVNDAVKKQLALGSTFSVSNKLEIDVAELLVKHIPDADGVRFGKNGADATSIAVRLSRAITKRDHIAFCGYHGWHDWFIGTTDLNSGIPKFNNQLAHSFAYNNISSLEKIFSKYKNKIACVIMEPITVNGPISKPSGSTKWKDYNKKDNFLTDVKKLCKKNGALLVFDEVVTGFRYDIGGAQKMYDVIPDLSCWAKAMSNGIPLSAITGRKKYIKFLEKTFFSFTYGGDCIGLAAAKATIQKIEKKNVIDHLYKVGGYLKKGMNNLAKMYDLEDMIACAGYPCRSVMTIKKFKRYDKPLITKSLIQQELMFRGVLWSQYHSISYSHKKKHIDSSLNAFEDAFKKLSKIVKNNKSIENSLIGKPCETVFTRVADFQAVATSQKN